MGWEEINLVKKKQSNIHESAQRIDTASALSMFRLHCMII
jgi:hypothetical protein